MRQLAVLCGGGSQYNRVTNKLVIIYDTNVFGLIVVTQLAIHGTWKLAFNSRGWIVYFAV
jgi:hypothetical protein